MSSIWSEVQLWWLYFTEIIYCLSWICGICSSLTNSDLFHLVINLILSQCVCGAAGIQKVDCAAALGNILLDAVKLTLIALLLIKWNEGSGGMKSFREKYLYVLNRLLASKLSKTILEKNMKTQWISVKSKNKYILCNVYFGEYLFKLYYRSGL